MKKILVTTDFSANSASGLLFVNQWASQTPLDITFLYVQQLIRPTSWGDASFETYKEEQTEIAYKELHDFISKTLAQAGKAFIDLAQCKYIVTDHASIEKAVLEYAQNNAIEYICVSTRGAGTLKKVIGTNTSGLIKHSPIPVISVPAHYQVQPLTHVLYASDLKHLDTELPQVVQFAEPLGAEVELLHFNTISETLESESVQETVQKFSNYKVQVHLESPDYVKSLVAHIKEAIQKSDTSMVVMFTDQNRSFFQRVFVSSKAADYSFDAPVPLLTFKK